MEFQDILYRIKSHSSLNLDTLSGFVMPLFIENAIKESSFQMSRM